MTGHEKILVQFMEGSDKRFIIPVYQRNYDWREENCKQLYDDLIKTIRQNRPTHFFGSIVSVNDPEGPNTHFLIIDGQQRLTTVSLLLLALHNAIKSGDVQTDDSKLQDRVYDEYLVDKYQPRDTRIKLKPVKDDGAAFSKLFENDRNEHISDSNLTINYNYFYDRILRGEITPDELFEAIKRLQIIDISLTSGDNPQLIFESLNSTGLALSEGDKIRNFILMGLTSVKQEEFYENYWNKIEKNVDYNVSSFVRDYLSIKQLSTPSNSKIYFAFKQYVEEKENSSDIEELLKDLLDYSKEYRILLSGGMPSKIINGCINRLNRLDTTVTRPFFMQILKDYDEGELSIENLEEIFSIIECYLFRRILCEIPTNALNKIFLYLNKDVRRCDKSSDNYVEKLKYVLCSKNGTARFPDDDEFRQAMITKPVYLMNPKNKTYILERFENHGTAEDKDVYRHLADGDYSIEHIMPQHLTSAWKEALGPDYEVIHDEWLHRMANLTLTAYNSSYSNNTFIEKRDLPGKGYRDSGLRMNQTIANKDKWDLEELEERSKTLAEQSLTIWQYPNTAYRPAEKPMDSISLDDEESMQGRDIIKYSFKGIEHPANSWVDMMENVIRELHSGNKIVLNKVSKDDASIESIAVNFSTNPDKLRSAQKIDDNIYFEKNMSTDSKLTVLKRLFELYAADPSELVFYLKSADDEPGAETEEREIWTIRRKYWSKLIPELKKEFGPDGPFSEASPTKYRSISGWFGIGGFYLCCCINNDKARVEFDLNSSKKEKNKKAFDILFKDKDEIEKELNTRLDWCRLDENRLSAVCISLRDVSIRNVDDWDRMVLFHSEWAKKLYDVLYPRIWDQFKSQNGMNQ